MKPFYLISLAALLLLLQLPAFAQRTSGKDEELVKQVVQQWFEGFSQQDHRLIERHSTADLQLLEDGVIWNTDSIRTFILRQKSSDFSRVNRFDFISSRVQGSTAWVVYRNRADIRKGARSFTVEWLESAVLVKEAGEWKVQMLHSTVAPSRKR